MSDSPATDDALTVLVIGATGAIGRLVVEVAQQRGDRVIAVSRPRSVDRVPAGAEVLEADITGPLELPDVDAVVMVHGTHGDAEEAERVDYGAVAHVLDALGTRPARIALMTAIGVTAPGRAAQEWKRRSERVLRASGRPYTIVRPSWFDRNDDDQHRLELLQGDRRRAGSPEDGVIASRQIAEVLVGALHIPAADRRTFELVAEHGPAQDDLEPLFAALRPDPEGALDGVLDIEVVPVEDEPQPVRDRLAG